MTKTRLITAAACALILSACGGGDGGSNPPPTTFTISGTISGATGVTVTLSGAASATTTTDGAGGYSFAGLSNGAYVLTPSKTGYAFNPLNIAVTLSGANATGKDFTATAAAATYSISGAVTGDVADGVTITLTGTASGTATTAGGGAYSFAGLIDGNYTVTPSKAGYTFTPTSLAVTVAGADRTGQDFTAAGLTYTIAGHVAGAPSVTVNLTGGATSSTTTDVSGSFSFTVHAGSYVLTPSRTGFTFTPASRSVTVVDASVLGQDFTAAVSSTYTLSGTVTGPWVEGITVTLGGAATQTTTTSSTGTYSFSGLANDLYTVTPALDGYFYTPSSPTVSMGGGNQTQNFTAASEIASYSISGTVTYAGAKSGRVYVRAWSNTCGGCSPVGGRSVVWPTASTFTIRGLPADDYYLTAELDSLGTGADNAINPNGSTATFTVSANVAGKTIALTDPAPPTPTAPANVVAYPGKLGSGSVLLIWDTVGSPEECTAYDVSRGTDTGANGTTYGVPARDDGHYFQGDLVAGTPYYYKVRCKVGAVVSNWSTVAGPVTVGGLDAGGHSVSGTISFTGTASGALYVGAYASNGSTFRFTRLAAPVTSPAPFSLAGLPDGSYYVFAIVDQDGSGTINDGDFANTNGSSASNLTVAGADVTGKAITISSANASAQTFTDHVSPSSGSEWYQVNNRIWSEAKRLVGVTMFSGKGVRVPADLAKEWEFQAWSNGGATRPSVGDTYRFMVRYYDDTTEATSSQVTAVLDSFAQNLAEDTTSMGCSDTVPCFTWSAPSSPPAQYGYRIGLWGIDANWWYPDSDVPLPSSTLSVVYDADGGAWIPALTSGETYTWSVMVEDATHNRATKQRDYAVP